MADMPATVIGRRRYPTGETYVATEGTTTEEELAFQAADHIDMQSKIHRERALIELDPAPGKTKYGKFVLKTVTGVQLARALGLTSEPKRRPRAGAMARDQTPANPQECGHEDTTHGGNAKAYYRQCSSCREHQEYYSKEAVREEVFRKYMDHPPSMGQPAGRRSPELPVATTTSEARTAEPTTSEARARFQTLAENAGLEPEERRQAIHAGIWAGEGPRMADQWRNINRELDEATEAPVPGAIGAMPIDAEDEEVELEDSFELAGGASELTEPRDRTRMIEVMQETLALCQAMAQHLIGTPELPVPELPR